MGKNLQLDWIMEGMPDYEKCKKEFAEHFSLFLRLRAVNYSALAPHLGVASPPHEIAGIFLAGLAIGRGMEISENEGPERKIDVFSLEGAWTLVEDELRAIRPEPTQGGTK